MIKEHLFTTLFCIFLPLFTLYFSFQRILSFTLYLSSIETEESYWWNSVCNPLWLSDRTKQRYFHLLSHLHEYRRIWMKSFSFSQTFFYLSIYRRFVTDNSFTIRYSVEIRRKRDTIGLPIRMDWYKYLRYRR